jgi:ABC-2 type transport system permease protein
MNATLSMSRRRLWRAYLIDTKYEFVRTIRSPIVYVSLLVMPVGMYTFLSVVLAGTIDRPVDIRTAQQAGTFANWIVFALMGPAMMSFGIGVAAAERQTGVMTFKRALPMPPFAFLLSKLLSVAIFACVVIALMTAVNVLFHAREPHGGAAREVFAAGEPSGPALLRAGIGDRGVSSRGGGLRVRERWLDRSGNAGRSAVPVPRWLAMWTPTYYAGQLNRAIVGLPTDVPAWTSVVVLTPSQ